MTPIDYLDSDVAYLLGMLVARGEISSSENVYRINIHFPKGNLIAEGQTRRFDVDKEVSLGIEKIRERLVELLDADIRTVDESETKDLVIRTTRRSMAWRNISMILNDQSSFPYFEIPQVFFDPNTPYEFKREFLRGYADVAGNIRLANRDQTGRHRVRLDILNYPTNWKVPVQLCILLQNHLNVGVPSIIWGHPNLGREWREHQLNVYAEDFLSLGFYFDYKQAALNELASINQARGGHGTSPCPGQRLIGRGRRKPSHPEEHNSTRLDPNLVGRHYTSYWQICRELGCPRRPPAGAQLEMGLEESE